MKKYKKILCLILVLVLLVTIYAQSAYAEVLTTVGLAAGLIAVASAAGVIFSATNQSARSMQTWAKGKIDSFLNGRSIAEVFGSAYIRAIAGKLVIPASIYNAINGMINDEIEETGVEPGDEPVDLSGNYYGRAINMVGSGNPLPVNSMISYDFASSVSNKGLSVLLEGKTLKVYIDGELKSSHTSTVETPTKWALFHRITNTNRDLAIAGFAKESPSSLEEKWWGMSGVIGQYEGEVTIQLTEPYIDEPIDVGYQWEGEIDGLGPDTNLQDMIDAIYNQSAIDNLNIDSQIDEETPYPPEPTTIPIDDVLEGIDTVNENLTGIDQNIITGVNDTIDAIHSQTAVQQEALEAIEEQTQTIEGIKEILEPDDIETKKFDLRRLFPFCIPFDIYNFLQKFDAAPQAPHVQLPFVIESIGFEYMIDLDFSAFDGLAQALRTLELIVYCLGLAWATSKVIKW